MSGKNIVYHTISLFAGSVPAYFAVSFFSFFYSSPFSFILLGFMLSVLFQFLSFFLTFEIMKLHWKTEMASLFVFLLAGGLAIATLSLCWHFPTLFNRSILFMDGKNTMIFAGLTLLSLGVVTVLQPQLMKHGFSDRLRASRVFGWICDNLPGLLLGSIFFLIYFSLALTVNFPGYYTLDQYFDTDISAWMARLQAASPNEIVDVVRAVHPAVLLFLRPLVWLASLLLSGDRLHAIFIVHALAAAACVFLMWRIVRHASSNIGYALMAALLLGASTSHLLLGSMLETYIYSSLALLFFVSLLQTDTISLKSTVLAGVIVFGITVTNLVQTVILYFIKQPRIKIIFIYVLMVIVIVFGLNLVQARIYPAAKVMHPSNLQREQRYQFDLTLRSRRDSWRIIGRVSLMTRAVLLYGIVAPKPFILTEELGMNVPNFRTFEITSSEFHIAGYTDQADFAVKIWMLILVSAVILFILSWFKNTKPVFQIGLLACIGFNFALHVLYGDDPILYSPDWVYLLVLFVMFSFIRFADRKWFQIPFAAFLLLEMVANLNLVHQIMEVSAPFYGH